MHWCVGAVLIQEKKILLGQRSLGRALSPGIWDVFGGHIEPHEQAEDALLRELKEEIGIEPTEWLYLETIKANLDGLVIDCRLYKVTRWRGIPTNRQPEEHATIQWFPLEAAVRLDLAHSAYPALFARCLNDPTH